MACAIVVSAQSAEPVPRRGNYLGHTARPLRYRPDGTDFVIANGPEFFNRPLYSSHTGFRIDGGDKPQFSLFVPGHGGNLRLGLRTNAGSKWADDATSIVARYRPGSLLYEIRDPLWANHPLLLTVLPLNTTEGVIAKAEMAGVPSGWALVWAYGGADGRRGSRNGDIGTEREPVSQFFQVHPEDCRGNTFAFTGNQFSLRSADAVMHGNAPPAGHIALADARQWGNLTALLRSRGTQTELPVITVEQPLSNGQPQYFLLHKTSANDPPLVSSDLHRTFDDAESYRRSVANKVRVNTPDPFVNAAAAALNIAADAVWDERQGVYMHGAVAWRVKLLGWRGPYVADELGWHDRALRHMTYWAAQQNTGPAAPLPIKPDTSVHLGRNEPALHSNGDLSHSHYDMNRVYIDELFRHFLWTGDLAFARRVWPVIVRHLSWERRLFRREFGPDHLPLYEAYAVIWASDDLQYNGGGAAHSSAYNYFHNRMAAKLARVLGEDPALYDHEADAILKAIQQFLWLPHEARLAEWKDLTGLQLAHPAAALWTFYHAVDSDVLTPQQAWQASRFIDTDIAHIPVHGPGVPKEGDYTLPDTNWMPYTWSTNNVVMAEAQHTALGFWQAGRADQAFRLFKGSLLDSMYLGLCPGNVGMTTYFDMARGEAQRDFADGVGTTSRALIEGLFGVHPDVLASTLRLNPGFPTWWDHARLQHPDLNFSFEHKGDSDRYSIEQRFPKTLQIKLEIPARLDRVNRVTVNGAPAKWLPLPSAIGTPRIEVDCGSAAKEQIEIRWRGSVPKPSIDHAGFVQLRQGQMTWWSPGDSTARPPYEVIASENQDPEHLRFHLRNNTSRALDGIATIHIGQPLGERSQPVSISAKGSGGESAEILLPVNIAEPGTNPLRVDLSGGNSLNGEVTNWHLRARGQPTWETVDLKPFFNDDAKQIFGHQYLSPRSPFTSLAIPTQGFGSWIHYDANPAVDDRGLRAASDRGNGKLVLPQGVPFETPGTGAGPNIIFTSKWQNFPPHVAIPLHGTARHVYFLMAGSTNSMQSQFVNGRVKVRYRDGSERLLELRNPENWWPIDQDYFIDDYAFRRPEPIPPRVNLRTGEIRTLDVSAFKGHGGTVPSGAATVLDLPIDPQKELQSLTVETVANEVVVGLMAVTLLR